MSSEDYSEGGATDSTNRLAKLMREANPAKDAIPTSRSLELPEADRYGRPSGIDMVCQVEIRHIFSQLKDGKLGKSARQATTHLTTMPWSESLLIEPDSQDMLYDRALSEIKEMMLHMLAELRTPEAELREALEQLHKPSTEGRLLELSYLAQEDPSTCVVAMSLEHQREFESRTNSLASTKAKAAVHARTSKIFQAALLRQAANLPSSSSRTDSRPPRSFTRKDPQDGRRPPKPDVSKPSGINLSRSAGPGERG